MASEYLQTGVVGPSSFPLHLLLPLGNLPISVRRTPEKNIRTHSRILQRARELHPFGLCLGFLCHNSYEQMVESIYIDSLARFDSCLRISHHSRE